MLEPIARVDLVDDVYARLRHAILSGALPPSERLVEDQLAVRLGVSRAPVRDALMQLERDGLVASSGRRGRVVKALSSSDAWEVYTLRGTLEGMAFRLAIPMLTPTALTELDALVAEMRRVGEQGDRRALSALDVQFHETVCRASQHKRLIAAWESMSSQIRLLSQQVIDILYADLLSVSPRHRLLLDLLRGGEPEAAERGARQHIDSVALKVEQLLRDAEHRSESRAGSTLTAGSSR